MDALHGIYQISAGFVYKLQHPPFAVVAAYNSAFQGVVGNNRAYNPAVAHKFSALSVHCVFYLCCIDKVFHFVPL